MLFNSMVYMAFLPIVFALYWIVPHRFRVMLVLTVSYYFYMSWNAKYVLLIAFTTLVSYLTAIFLEKNDSLRRKKHILLIAILVCISVLFVFKYFNFFFESVSKIAELFSIRMNPITLTLLLPVGISFYTFQSLSYIIDVYRGRVKAERNLVVYATFVSFFPQLVAGPIERTENLLPQIKAKHQFDYQKAIEGAKLMVWGYYKKLVIADNMAVYVDTVYNSLSYYSGFDKMIAIFFFSIQIYCDFSGYSDIAIGTAKLLDIDLMKNFNAPYFSSSIKEFWAKWHISLSTWLKDYIYIPLGGNRCSKVRNAVNLLITFLISGLWHGANWTYVAWGGLHGVAQVIENIFNSSLERFRSQKVGRVIANLGVYVFCAFAWAFFRAESFGDALSIVSGAFEGIGDIVSYLSSKLISMFEMSLILGVVVVLGLHECVECDLIFVKEKIKDNKILNWLLYLMLGMLIILCSRKDVAADFVYFQF